MAIKKIEIRPKGTGNYEDVLYPKTSADMVETDDERQFVSQSEKNKWNAKQDALSADRIRKVTVSNADPSGGEDGDIWIKYKE